MTKTVRSPFNHEIGEKVEGCTILEKRVVIPPDPIERRRGIYDYLVEAPPLPEPARSGRGASGRPSKVPVGARAKGAEGFTRATPEEAGSGIRGTGGAKGGAPLSPTPPRGKGEGG